MAILFKDLTTLQLVREALEQLQLSCASLVSDVPRRRRDEVLKELNLDKRRILLLTYDFIDGIRVEHLKLLLFYDFPPSLEQYCGGFSLLAQGGDDCTSFSLLTRQSSHLAGALLSMLE